MTAMFTIYITAADTTAGDASVSVAVPTAFPRGLVIADIATEWPAGFPLECGNGAGHQDERERYDCAVHPILLCFARTMP
jgi:hypothetical protein